MDGLEEMLAEGLRAMGLSASARQQSQLLKFLDLLRKWNRVYNLTAIDQPPDMVRLHLLDSLSLSPHLSGARILDVGTGAGLPGIPLALCDPDRQFVLLDSNARKTRFVRQAAIELGLANVAVEQARIERYRPASGFDGILCRAFASLPEIVRATAHLLNPGGVILAQKGRWPAEELAALAGAAVEALPLSVPGVAAARHLMAIRIQG